MPDRTRPLTSDLSAPRLHRLLVRLLRGHPTEAALERYHERHRAPRVGGPAAATSSRVDHHLAGCAECRGWLEWRHALGMAARGLAAAPTPAAARPELLESGIAAVLHRRTEGERVFISPAPAAVAPELPARSNRRVARVGAAAAAALAAALLARAVPSAGAGLAAGELTIAPRVPRLGDTLAVRYRPNALLAGAPRLRLRAMYYLDDDTKSWGRPAVTAAWLTPGPDGAYRARVALPPGTAYARFAVEDSGAHTVDAHGREPWDVVLADGAGRPRVPGIRSQSIAADPGAWERQRQLTLEATRVHPDHPSGWWARARQDVELVGSSRTDSVAVAARPLVARLDIALGRVAVRESWAMLDLASFAEFARVPEVHRRWRARLLADRPRSVAAYSLRMTDLWRAKVFPAAQLDSLERWWVADGDSLSLFVGQGVGLAMAVHDTAAARRWAARAVGAAPVASVFVAQQLVRDPALAAAGVAYARADVARLAAGDAERPLDATAAAWARERARRAREALAVVGQGLLALGRPRDAAAALADATAEGWNADAFRLFGEARLASGDTAGALGAFAYAVADPSLGRRLADSLTMRLGGRLRDSAWSRAVADARGAMHARVLGASAADTLRGDPRVGESRGRRRRLSEVRAGRVAVVAMLSSHCGAALSELPATAQLRAGLADRPVAFVALTDDAPGGTAERELRARGLTWPLWYDLDGEGATALDARGTPTYLVLDRAGAVRWRGYRIRDASPVLDALLAADAGR